MALNRRTFIDRIGIDRDGILHVRFTMTFFETDDEAAEITKRHYIIILYPGDNVNNRLAAAAAALSVTRDVMPPNGELNMLRNVATTVWIPAVVNAWIAKKALLDAAAGQ